MEVSGVLKELEMTNGVCINHQRRFSKSSRYIFLALSQLYPRFISMNLGYLMVSHGIPEAFINPSAALVDDSRLILAARLHRCDKGSDG